MDVHFNPLKGLILDGPKGFTSALFGRRNYDFDTGHWTTDLAAEIALDPLNWITLGGKAAATAGAKGAIKAAIGTGTKELAEAVGKKTTRALIIIFILNLKIGCRFTGRGISRRPDILIESMRLATLTVFMKIYIPGFAKIFVKPKRTTSELIMILRLATFFGLMS